MKSESYTNGDWLFRRRDEKIEKENCLIKRLIYIGEVEKCKDIMHGTVLIIMAWANLEQNLPSNMVTMPIKTTLKSQVYIICLIRNSLVFILI
jgi:hypothetical protein